MKDAYKIFTIDKVLGALVKHLQVWEQDGRNDKLVKLLWDERQLERPSADDHRRLRHQAEGIVGPDEHFFRIDRHPDAHALTFQLLGRDEAAEDDSEVASGRWQAYIESFVAVSAMVLSLACSGHCYTYIPTSLYLSSSSHCTPAHHHHTSAVVTWTHTPSAQLRHGHSYIPLRLLRISSPLSLILITIPSAHHEGS